MSEDTREELLAQALGEMGISSTGEQRALMLRHLDLVEEKNKVMNLTRITDARTAAILHIVDSLLLLDGVNGAPTGAMLDIGTGAGFPGIPLAVMTGRGGLLIDSVGKKAAAVQEFLRVLGLDGRLQARQERAEELALKERGQYAVVVARAVSQLNTLVEYATPLLKKGGRLVVTKGNLTPEERTAGEAAATICGLRNVSRETFELPQGLGHREILTFEKFRGSQVKLPRKTGMAQHHPLGV